MATVESTMLDGSGVACVVARKVASEDVEVIAKAPLVVENDWPEFPPNAR